MQVARQHMVDMLRMAALPDLAEEAHRELPNPVDDDLAERFLAQHGITQDWLISRRGGSP